MKIYRIEAINKLSLKLFNCVLSDPNQSGRLFVSKEGFVVSKGSYYALNTISDYFEKSRLSGMDLNRTFYQSWSTITNKSRWELLVDQIIHYYGTYGGGGYLYIPNKVLPSDIPQDNRLIVIDDFSQQELTNKCLSILQSGIALKTETIDDVLALLALLGYQHTGKEGIKNKEAIAKIASTYDIYPDQPEEFFRFIVYSLTGETLLIKNKDLIDKIKVATLKTGKGSKYSTMMGNYGFERLAEIFNRFKPLFLAMKPMFSSEINKISKLSKKHHKPLPRNILNHVTTDFIHQNDMHWLNNATSFALFRALNALHIRLQGKSSFTYRIRNGKSWTKTPEIIEEKGYMDMWNHNFRTISNHLMSRYDFSDKKFYIPKNIEYALPSSEKSFIGNIPYGSSISSDHLSVGIYWRDDYGVRDYDLKGLGVKDIGWNSSYVSNGIVFSGDITSAPNGAVEYLSVNSGKKDPTLVMNTVFTSSYKQGTKVKFKMIVGDSPNHSRNYMMDPNNLILEEMIEIEKRECVMGLIVPDDDKVRFYMGSFTVSQSRVTGSNPLNKQIKMALFDDFTKQYSLSKLISDLGGTLVDAIDEDTIDLSPDKLQKDTFIKIFE
jgi:hypothetical protein